MNINDRISDSQPNSLDKLYPSLPDHPDFAEGIRRAPKRDLLLDDEEIELALKNALRYIPEKWQGELAPEFLAELLSTGRIYGYRFRPEGRIQGLPINKYQGKCLEGKAFQVMIDNNLDFETALYPYELVTYGETGQVCQNWMQYHLIKRYLRSPGRRCTLRQTRCEDTIHSSGRRTGTRFPLRYGKPVRHCRNGRGCEDRKERDGGRERAIERDTKQLDRGNSRDRGIISHRSSDKASSASCELSFFQDRGREHSPFNGHVQHPGINRFGLLLEDP